MKPMRMLVLLAVFWAAGSLLLAAESPTTPAPKPAAEASKPEVAPKKTEGESKTDTKEGPKGSIAEQAEAALKAAAEADGSAASEPPQSEAETAAAKDDTQAPPASSAGKGPSPQRFVPSEQVRADFDVSFPIDI
jgi:hypothetical protein